MSITYHIPDSELNLLNGYDFYFRLRDSANLQFIPQPRNLQIRVRLKFDWPILSYQAFLAYPCHIPGICEVVVPAQ